MSFENFISGSLAGISILSSERAMPLKNLTSDDTSTFSRNRFLFTRSYEPKPKNKMELYNKNKILLNSNTNTDANQIVKNKKFETIAVGTLNSSKKQLAFTNGNEVNTLRDALHKTRSGGSRVPAKVTHKYKNAPVFYN